MKRTLAIPAFLLNSIVIAKLQAILPKNAVSLENAILKHLFIISILCLPVLVNGQNIQQEYALLIQKADSLYKTKDFKTSANTYSVAFKLNGWKGLPYDRYKSACSWALSGAADSAFFQLDIIVTKTNYKDYDHITTDEDLNSLHNDGRWQPLVDQVKQNKVKTEANLNIPLVAILDSIFVEDQKYRLQINGIEKQYGSQSKELIDHWKFIEGKDSINLLKVKSILDKYGWLGEDEIGNHGNTTLFLVIQHSDINTQDKYLPMMREAVKNGKAHASSLALLEDRVAFRHGKKQIYGSQIGQDLSSHNYYVLPLEDPDNVDKRRSEVGLEPLAEYVKHWNIKWNIEQYKKDLPKLEGKK